MKQSIFPLTYKWRGTTVSRAFFLAATAQAVIAALAIKVRSDLDNETSYAYMTFRRFFEKDLSGWAKTGVVFVSAFLAAIIIYHIMWAVFAYGGGLLAASNCKAKCLKI